LKQETNRIETTSAINRW